MKTLEEAVKTVLALARPENIEQVHAKLADLCERNSDLAREVSQNEDIRACVMGLAACLPVHQAIHSALMNGIMIGIEMERAPVGALAEDPKPTTKERATPLPGSQGTIIRIVEPVHQCKPPYDPPPEGLYGLDTIWRCTCGQEAKLVFDQLDGYVWRWVRGERGQSA